MTLVQVSLKMDRLSSGEGKETRNDGPVLVPAITKRLERPTQSVENDRWLQICKSQNQIPESQLVTGLLEMLPYFHSDWHHMCYLNSIVCIVHDQESNPRVLLMQFLTQPEFLKSCHI